MSQLCIILNWEGKQYKIIVTLRFRLVTYHGRVPFEKWKLQIERFGVSRNSKKTDDHNYARFINLSKNI